MKKKEREIYPLDGGGMERRAGSGSVVQHGKGEEKREKGTGGRTGPLRRII